MGGICGIWWGFEKSATTRLQARWDDVRTRGDEWTRLQKEHERLIHLKSLAIEARRLAGTRGTLVAVNPGESSAEPPGSLKTGTWAPSTDWRNCGRSSPESAVETALWAASGGDLNTLKESLYLGDEARSKAEAILANLPDDARRQYASPEDLLALIVAGNVPLDSALIVARQQNEADDVTEYVRLRDSQGRTRQVFLSLRKGQDGWRLSVPANTLAPIAKVAADSPPP